MNKVNLFFCCFLLWTMCNAQQDTTLYPVKVTYTDLSPSRQLKNYSSFNHTQKDIESSIRQELTNFQKEGFYEASLDQFYFSNDSLYALVHIGSQWEALKILFPGKSDTLLSEALRAQLSEVSPYNLEFALDKVVVQLVDKGYPFTTVSLSNAQVKDSEIFVDLDVVPGRRVYQNVIKVKGSSTISSEFLQRYLDWIPGEPYSHSRVLSIPGRMQGLRYLALVNDPKVKFFYDQAALEITVKKKRANKFDFLLGVLPGNDFQDRGLILSIFLNTELHNALGFGERILFDFRNTKPETQELELGFSYPYILNMPFGADFGFELFRNAESNLDLRYQLGFSYLPGKGVTVSTFYDRFSSIILNPDTLTLVNDGRLPQNLDHVNNKFGVALHVDKLDNPVSPRKGWEVKTKGSAGFKTIKTNNDLLELESPELPVQLLYDSITTRQEQFELDVYLANYLPFWKRFTFKTALHIRSILGASFLLENEQFRTGGSREIRGFDEEFFRASSYGVATGEVRFFLSNNSFLSAFVDYALIEKIDLNTNRNDTAVGFGLGFNFETKVGVFSLSYALGTTQDIPLDVNAGKVHFGYISLF